MDGNPTVLGAGELQVQGLPGLQSESNTYFSSTVKSYLKVKSKKRTGVMVQW